MSPRKTTQATVPIVIGYSASSTSMIYLSGDTSTGATSVSTIPGPGPDAIWEMTSAPNSNVYIKLDSVETGLRYLRGGNDGTVSLTDDCTLSGTQWFPDFGTSTGLITLKCTNKTGNAYLSSANGGLTFTSDNTPAASNWTIQPPMSVSDIGGLITAFGPLIHLHPDEQYKMCSLEWFLQHATLHDATTGTTINQPTFSQLPQTMDPANPKRYYLTLPELAKFGQMSTATAYVHALVTFAYTDLQFWFFYAYNGPGTAHAKSLFLDTTVTSGDPSLRPLGEHWGDWEVAVIRIDSRTKQPIGVWLSQHDSGAWFDESQIPSLERSGTQFVFYASRNGHAIYPTADSNYTEHFKLTYFPYGIEFWLRNDTALGSSTLDASKNAQIVATDAVFGAPAQAVWLSYPYRWGPANTESYLSVDRINEILYDAFGFLSLPLAMFGVTTVAASLLPLFYKDDVNGPEGPMTKTAKWGGNYS